MDWEANPIASAEAARSSGNCNQSRPLSGAGVVNTTGCGSQIAPPIRCGSHHKKGIE